MVNTILIVEDNELNMKLFHDLLEAHGYKTLQTRNGIDAIALARKHRPDLIVMDLSLPVLDGWEATRRLKGDARTRNVPVIALTGHALEGHSKGAADAGCDRFLAKPCLPQTLAETIKSMLEKSAAPSRAQKRTGSR